MATPQQSRRLQMTMADLTGGAPQRMNPWGEARAFNNDLFEGHIFFAHLPPPDLEAKGVKFEYDDLFARRGEPKPLWEVQVQGRFKKMPEGNVFLAGELRDGPMELGLVTRAICRAILKVIGAIAKNRGTELVHSFGTSDGERPLLGFYLMSSDRIFIHKEPMQLPILGDERRGVFQEGPGASPGNENWREVDRATAAKPRTDTFMTFVFHTSKLNWNDWCVQGIPGLGTLDLEQFWGKQAANFVICENPKNPKRKVFFEMKLYSPFVTGAEADEGQEKKQQHAPPTRSSKRGHERKAVPAERQPQTLIKRSISGPIRSASCKEQAVGSSARELESDRDDEGMTGEESSAMGLSPSQRPVVGSAVLVSGSRRRGRVAMDDGSEDLPIKVEFADGSLPSADWFSVDALRVVEGAMQESPHLQSLQEDDSEAGDGRELHLDQIEAQLDRDDGRVSAYSDADDDDGYSNEEESSEGKKKRTQLQGRAGSRGRGTAATAATSGRRTVSVPWYFWSNQGSLWWCIHHGNRFVWRPQAKLLDLCKMLCSNQDRLAFLASPTALRSVDGLEEFRRFSESTLVQALTSAPGVVEGFLAAEVSLEGLIHSTATSVEPELEVAGIVDTEGCVVERVICFHEGSIVWKERDSRDQRVLVQLKVARTELTEIATAPALLLTAAGGPGSSSPSSSPGSNNGQRGPSSSSPSHSLTTTTAASSSVGSGGAWGVRQVILVAPSAAHRAKWLEALRAGAVTTPTALTFFSKLFSRKSDSTTATAASEGSASCSPKSSRSSLKQRLLGRKLAVHSEPPVRRWPDGRHVLNCRALHLASAAVGSKQGGASFEALGFSARLLQDAIEAQSGGEQALLGLAIKSSFLKCIDLSALGPRQVWCFWVNVFHALLLHGRLALDIPSGIQQVISFFNRVSYIVAGHVFSLAEIEHSLLRVNLSQPKLKLKRLFLRVWNRSDSDLENRPCLAAPPAKASQFRCRADWQLSLVLSAGNYSCSDSIPIFGNMSDEDFERYLNKAACATLAATRSNELPYALYRYRDDAPPLPSGVSVRADEASSELRWSCAVTRLHGKSVRTKEDITLMKFTNKYDWKMRPSLRAL